MTDPTEWKVRGPVQTLRRDHAEWDSDKEAWKTPRGVSTVWFRQDGQVQQGESHNPDGSIARWARLYDDDGRVVEMQWWRDDGPKTRVRHAYDAIGRLAATVEVAPDGTRRDAETCQYDHAGRKTKVTFLPRPLADMPNMAYGIEGTEYGYGAPDAATLTVAYDDRDLPAEASFHGANGGLVRRVVFARDPEGRLVSEVAYFDGASPFPLAQLESDQVPLEDRTGLAALLKEAFADQVFSSVAYAYGAHGRLMEKTLRMGSLSENRTTFQYADHDDPILEVSEHHRRGMGVEDGAPRVTEEAPLVQHNRYDYQHDARGNWTERIVSYRVGSQPEFQRSNIERRTITYYES